MVPAINIHSHKVKLQPHIGIKVGFKKNKEVNTTLIIAKGQFQMLFTAARYTQSKPVITPMISGQV